MGAKEIDAVLSGDTGRSLSPTSPAEMWKLEKLFAELDARLVPRFRLDLIVDGYTPCHTELRKEFGEFVVYYHQGRDVAKYELCAIIRK